jgi:phage shock protein B
VEPISELVIPLVAIISLFVVLPGMAMYFADRKRRWQQDQAGAAGADYSRLLSIAERMERRIEALEKILDAESPGWRTRHHEH